MDKAKSRFNIHKSSARNRGIDFNLTFEEWYNWWLSNGVDKNYPTSQGPTGLCMCRIKDMGPYELGNIYCDTRSNNTRQFHIDYPRKGKDHGSSKRIVTPYGTFDSCSDAALKLRVSRKYLYNRTKSDPTNYYID